MCGKVSGTLSSNLSVPGLIRQIIIHHVIGT